MLAVSGLRNPDSALMRVMTFVPGCSSAALPARMVVSEVPAWQVPISVALLAAGIWVLRRLAGKVFAAGILSYGKEPSLREVARWLREA
jgi:ABC-2 type transport system permease protein